ncbi:MAG: 4-(cytidine 5'-diphospho)-2-C-methyl-D-erythritol kinase, partial [Desulfobacteraceae bacterium]|nr:4-(cytidine 5'-diphospho)-2-C-methyl-D-erythritol kinase [Desulfobacteraceae bacterium]
MELSNDLPEPLELRAPAKINLFLAVTGRRADGYHELLSLMCAIGLYDRVSLRFGGRGIRVSCDHPAVPEDDRNLVHRAASRFFDRLGVLPGVTIRIDKRIPVAAGLGGGSSDAAAVLGGLNRAFGRPFTSELLQPMALAVGADVPFFLTGKPALATGVGEHLEPVTGLVPYHVLTVCPDLKVSTAAVYKNLNLGLTKCEKKLKQLHLKTERFDALHFLCNDLETVTIRNFPQLNEIKKALLGLGAAGALMSGSGPT